MLCEACTEAFAFKDTETLQRMKTNAFNRAAQEMYSDSRLQILRTERDRYERALQSSESANSLLPNPWGIAALFETSSSPGFYTPYTGWSGRDWRELERSAPSTKCELCLVLVAMITSRIGITPGENATLSSQWRLDASTLLPQTLQVSLVDNQVELFVMKFHTAIETVSQADDEQKTDPVGLANSTKDEACLEHLSRALRHCVKHHKKCSRQQDDWIPTRLLQVKRSDGAHGDCIHLVERELIESDSPIAMYTTLSHMWGSKHPLQLLKANYEDFKTSIQMKDLPQCFADAVYITRQLGASYVWIDSLCIIQDSPEDWAQEAVTMGKVYRNGLCNIASADGTTSFSSIFTDRDPLVGAPLVFHRNFSDRNVKFTMFPDWVELTWDTAPLYKRGWVVQERFLPARIMHFSTFPFLECGEDLTTEVYPSHPRLQGLQLASVPKSQRSWLMTMENVEEAVMRWWEIVRRYARSDLTYGSDKLIALSGMASTMAETVGEEFYAGIWGGSYLILGLTWTVWGGTPRRELGSADYRAPSWSWASRDGLVALDLLRRVLKPLVQVLSVDIVPKTKNKFGQLSGGKIVLRGYLLDVIPNKLQELNHRWPNHVSLDCYPVPPFQGRVYFLPLAEVSTQDNNGSKGRTFSGLYIEETKELGDTTMPTYARVGDCGNMYRHDTFSVLEPATWDKLHCLESPGEHAEQLVLV